MKVLLPIATAQNLIVRPRTNVATVNLVIRDILKDTTTTSSGISTSFANGFLTIPFTRDFSEGETYSAEVTNTATGALLWRGLIYITAQTPQNFNYYV